MEPASPSMIFNEEEEYEVKKEVQKYRKHGRETQYLVY